jgi:hypothetical protein
VALAVDVTVLDKLIEAVPLGVTEGDVPSDSEAVGDGDIDGELLTVVEGDCVPVIVEV